MALPIKSIELKIGPYQVKSILTGTFALDGGAMFGTVPKVLWQKYIPSDEQNRIPMEARALLLKSQERIILVDTGNGGDFVHKYGEKLGSKFSQMYQVDGQGPSLIKSLAQHGVSPDQVTDVILTHLHFDHAGGATSFINGEVRATFKNAKYYIQAANLQTAQNPNIRERASYLAPNFEPLLQSSHMQVLSGPVTNLLPHISVQISDGHTVGQQNVIVQDSNSYLFYGADLIPTHAHVRKAWVMGYDLDPLKIIEEKTKVLKTLTQPHRFLFFEHDPFMDAAQVSEEGSDFKASQGFKFQ